MLRSVLVVEKENRKTYWKPPPNPTESPILHTLIMVYLERRSVILTKVSHGHLPSPLGGETQEKSIADTS